MLKIIRLLFLGLIVLAGSACVTPTHASSASSVVLTYLQASGPAGSKDEFIVLYNNGPGEVDITGWCLANKSAISFACFSEENLGFETSFIVPGYGYATIASREFVDAQGLSDVWFSLVYDVTNQSSGSLVGSGDVVSLLDAQGEVVDMHFWASTAPTGKYWARTKIMTTPDIYAVANPAADWSLISFPGISESMVEKRLTEVSLEPEEPEVPAEEPSQPTIIISEIFANAAGSDIGKEFIELHNPNHESAQVLGGLRLRIGLETAKWYDLPIGLSIPPNGYVTVTDAELGFTLPNTNGGVQLYLGDEALGDRIEYVSPKDDQAWAFIDGLWQYATPTPGAINSALTTESAVGEESTVVTTQKPCASNQFRNPETGRCKLISAAAKTATPCKEGQGRNAATNRCRTIVAATVPTPCKEGQERNPETNRCRNVTKMSTVNYGVKGVQEKAGAQLSWYYWFAIVGIVVLILAYAAWEWREEITGVWRRAKATFAKK